MEEIMSDNTTEVEEVTDWEIRMALQKEADQKSGKDAVALITKACNYGAGKEVAEGIIDALAQEHRTLQQDFWRVIREVAEKYSEFSHDLRNDASVEFCEDIKNLNRSIPRI